MKKHKKTKIDKVTTDRLDTVLKMLDINLPLGLLDNIIDVVELIEQRGGKVSLDDVSYLRDEWETYGHNYIERK